MQKEEPIHKELSYRVYGALFAAHNEVGRFANWQQYSDVIEKHLKLANIPYEREKVLPRSFEGEKDGRNRVDFLIADKIVLEIKVKNIVERADYYQVKRYLVALNKKLGILANFRDKYLRPKRILNSSASEV